MLSNFNRDFPWKGPFVVILIASLICIAAYWISTYTQYTQQIYCVQAYQLLKYGIIPRAYPLYPTFMAASLFVFGVTKYAFLLVPLLSIPASAVLTYWLSLRIFKDRSRALLSALVVASNPALIWLGGRGMSEPLFTAMLVLTIIFLIKEDASPKRMFLVGVLSCLTLASKVAGLWLFAFIPVLIFLRKGSVKSILAFFGSVIVVLLLYRDYALGIPLGLGWLLHPPSVDSSLLPTSIPNIVVGYGILFAYCIPLLCPFLRSFLKRPNPRSSEGVVFYYALSFLLFMTPYYIWDPFREVSLAGSNFARYTVAAVPLVAIFSDFSRKGKMAMLVAAVCVAIGTVLGLYLVCYGNIHARAALWDAFLAYVKTL